MKSNVAKTATATMLASTMLSALMVTPLPNVDGVSNNAITAEAATKVVKTKYAYKTKTDVTVRKTTSKWSAKVATFKKGTFVSKGTTTKYNGVTYVKVSNGSKTGYIKLSSLQTKTYKFNAYKSASSATKAQRYKVNKGTYLRKEAGLHPSNKKLAQLTKGKFVKIVGTQVVNGETYAKVNSNGKTGYVLQKRLTVKKASSEKKATVKTGQITSNSTLRNTYGTDWTTKSLATVKKGDKVTIVNTIKFDGVSYTKIKTAKQTGYVKSSVVKAVKETAKVVDETPLVIPKAPTETTTADGFDVDKTTEATQLKTYTLKSGYAYLKSTPTQHVDEEDDTVESLDQTTLITYTGKVDVDGVKYKQVVYNGQIGYILDSVELLELKQSDLTTKIDYLRNGEFYYTKQDLLVLPQAHFIPYGAETTISKHTAVTVVNKVYNTVTDAFIGFNIQYLEGGKVKSGFAPSGTIILYQPAYGEPDDVTASVNKLLDSPLKNGNLNHVADDTVSQTPSKDAGKTETPSKDADKTETKKETSSVSTSFDTSLNDDRVRIISSTKAKIYSVLPTSKNNAQDIMPFTLDYYYGQVLKISSAQTTDKGTFVKIAYGNKKTAYIETKYLSNVGNKAYVPVKRNMTGSFDDVSGAADGENRLPVYTHASKEAYAKYASSFYNFLHVPTKITSDGVLVPADASDYYSRNYRVTSPNFTWGLPQISWSDIKGLKAYTNRTDIYSTPTTIESVLKTYSKTKNYAFELENNYDDVHADTHIALAKMIKKYGLENNSIIYSYTSQDGTDTDKINKEIKEISSKIKIIYVENFDDAKKVSKNPSVYTKKANIDGVAVYSGYLTDEIAKTIKDAGLEVHAMSYDRQGDTIGTATTKFTKYNDYLDGYLTESIRTPYEKTAKDK